MSVTSADPAELDAYADAAGATVTTHAAAVEALTGRAASVIAACAFSNPETNTMVMVGQLIDGVDANGGFVASVASALRAAEQGDGGVVSVSAASIDAALAADGTQAAPDHVDTFTMVMMGMPATSGFVDDPVNAASGNFVHGDRDLIVCGRAEPISPVRVYNSTGQHLRGRFGWGWSALIDAAVITDGLLGSTPRRPVVRLPDGQHLPFTPTPDDDAVLTCAWRADIELAATADGWVLTDQPGRTWTFDDTGALTGGHGAAHDITVTSTDTTITVAEHRSGRDIAYHLDDDGLVVRLQTSDGRTCAYRHDDRGHLVAVTRACGDLTYGLDEHGRVAQIIDADGVTTVSSTFDETGRVISQTSVHGRTTDYTYGDDGVTAVADADPDGPRNVFIHDRRGRLLSMFDSTGASARRTYDSFGHPATLTDREGHTTSYVNDRWGQVLERTDADGHTHRTDRDHLGRVIFETDRAGLTTTFTYEGEHRAAVLAVTEDGAETRLVLGEDGRPTAHVDADGVRTAFTFDADGQVLSVIDGLGRASTFTYDAAGRLVGATGPHGTTSFVLDEAGRLTHLDAPWGSEDYTYTPAGRGLTARRPDEDSRVEYGPAGVATAVIDAAGNRTAFAHDHNGRVVTITAPDGAAFHQTFDPVGRLTAVVDEAGHTSRMAYDREGRQVRIEGPDGRTFARTVDHFGRTTTITGPDGAVQSRTYHPVGHVRTVTDPDGGVRRVEIDAHGRAVASTDQAGRTTRYAWSAAGRLLAVITPSGRTERREYDAAGQLAATISPDGTRRPVDATRPGGASRDAGRAGPGRPVMASTSAALEAGPAPMDARVHVDARGLLRQVVDPAGVITAFDHDVRGRTLTSQTQTSGTAHAYDPAGWMAMSIDPTGAVTRFAHDPAGRLDHVDRGGAAGTDVIRDAVGAVVGIDGRDGTRMRTLQRDDLGRIDRAWAPGTEAVSVERDPVGQPTAVHGHDGTRRYRFDPDGLLVQRIDPDGTTTSVDRAVDGRIVGYRMAHPGGAAELQARVPDLSADRQHDPDGRLTADERGRTYAYDAAGRLRQTMLPDGTTTTSGYDDRGLLGTERTVRPDGTTRQVDYEYDAAGRIVRRTADGRSTRYGYDAAGRRRDAHGPDGSHVGYRYDDLDQLVGIDRTDAGGRTRRCQVTRDAMGRPIRILLDDGDGGQLADGSVVDIGYDDLTGKAVRIGDTTVVRHRDLIFDGSAWQTGRHDDPWGDDGQRGVRLSMRAELAVDDLVLMGARAYDPASRQFLTPDPLPQVIGRPCYASTHAYAWNDPVNYLDPTGAQPLSDEDFNALRDAEESSNFENAWDAMADDPWGTLAMVGVTAVGVGLLFVPGGQVIGAGILIGVGTSAAVGLATDSFNPRGVAVSGVIGGIAGPLGGFSSVPAAAATGVAIGATEDIAYQLVVEGRSLTELDPLSIVVSAGTGGVIDGGGRVLSDAFGSWRAGRAAADAPPTPTSTTSMGSEFDGPARMHDQPVAQLPTGDGPVTFRPPPNPTPDEIRQVQAYVDGSNAALRDAALSPTGRVSTGGQLRIDATASARAEGRRAADAGTPYRGHVGHVPDTTWVGRPDPHSWLDLDPRVNMSLGGQATGYPVGFRPTEFVYEGPQP